MWSPAAGDDIGDTQLMTVGVEEEFHIVDLVTRQLAPEAATLLGKLPTGRFGLELQRSVVEANTKPHAGLDDLREELVELRGMLAGAAEARGLAAVAAGTVPLADVDTLEISSDARYQRMRDAYRMAVREQLICGVQVHVDVPDREVALGAMRWIAPHLPALLALSASSPYWLGSDSGYASWRTQVWQRWPTAGPAHPFGSASEYDEVVAGLVRSGVISDPGMIYFDVRPSAHLPTIELRICDACPCVDDAVLIAALFRAMTRDACAAVLAGQRPPGIPPEWLRAATWRAARSGLEAELVDVATMVAAPAEKVLADLLTRLRPALEAFGDWELTEELAASVLARGTSAARQRRMFGRTQTLAGVVDLLIAETRADPDHLPGHPWPRRLVPAGDRGLLRGYHAPADEAVERGAARPPYEEIVPVLERLGARGLAERAREREAAQREAGVTFRVAGEEAAQTFPFDAVPRVVTAADAAELGRGLVQRVRALEMFLRDVHGPAEAVRDGIVPGWAVARRPGLRTDLGRVLGPERLRIAVAGIDLVHDEARRWVVLEDNLRVPSGLAYGIVARELTVRFFPELEPPRGLLPVADAAESLRAGLAAAAPPRAQGDPGIALLSSGASDSAYFEHAFLARRLGIAVVTPADLEIGDDLTVTARTADGPRRIDVLYRRHDEDGLFPAQGNDADAASDVAAGSADGPSARRPGAAPPVGARLLAALRAGTVSLANAPGNGVADDKVLYAFVPRLIEYYLGERPLLAGIRTYLCALPEDLAYVVGHLDELVVKPADGYGGVGVVIGPHATREQLNETRALVEADPARWVAQQPVTLSTHPTFNGERFEPRAVDLRAFVFNGERPVVSPAALTRVAPAGSLIVNSSRGGGAKDTWMLADG